MGEALINKNLDFKAKFNIMNNKKLMCYLNDKSMLYQ
jgi:hypothetical protein